MTDVASPGAAISKELSGKPFYKSKTLWMSVATAIIPFVPVLGPWCAANPQMLGVILGFAFSALRLATKDRIVVS